MDDLDGMYADLPDLELRVVVYGGDTDGAEYVVIADRMFENVAQLEDAERAGMFSDRVKQAAA